MASKIKLSVREIARLRQIQARKRVSFGKQPVTTKKLLELGLIDRIGGRIAQTGRIRSHSDAGINAAGIAALADKQPAA